MELWHHFQRLCAVFQLMCIRCDCNRVCMFIVINVFHIWLVLVYYRNYIFILMTSALSISPLWRHNDATYFRIQDFTKGMNMMRLEKFFLSNVFSFHWCHCIGFSFYSLFHFGFHSLAYVCRKLSVLFSVLAFIFNLCKFYVTGDSYFLHVICLHIYLVLITSLYAWFPYHTQSESLLMVVLRCFT